MKKQASEKYKTKRIGADTGDEVHDLILDEIRGLSDNIDDLKDKMFVGNGQPSLCSQINTNTIARKIIIWAIGIIYVALIGAIVNGNITINANAEPEAKIKIHHGTNGVPCLITNK